MLTVDDVEEVGTRLILAPANYIKATSDGAIKSLLERFNVSLLLTLFLQLYINHEPYSHPSFFY